MTDYIIRADAICEVLVNDGIDNIVDRINNLPSTELPKGDLISRADVLKYPIRLDHYDEVNGSREFVYGVESVIEYVESLPSADAIPIERYHELQHQFVMLGASFADRVEVVRCKDCRHADECQKSVQYTRNEPRTITIGYSPIEWCSHGERREE